MRMNIMLSSIATAVLLTAIIPTAMATTAFTQKPYCLSTPVNVNSDYKQYHAILYDCLYEIFSSQIHEET